MQIDPLPTPTSDTELYEILKANKELCQFVLNDEPYQLLPPHIKILLDSLVGEVRYNHGHEDGYEEGYEDGYDEAKAELEAELEAEIER